MKSTRILSLFTCIVLAVLLLVSYRSQSWWPFKRPPMSQTQSQVAAADANSLDTEQHVITVLCLGDSLTEGYGIAEDHAYPAMLQQRFEEEGIDNVRFINAGISGSTSASALKRLEWHLQQEPKPQVLLLALGANDGLRGLPVKSLQQNLATTIVKAQDEGLIVVLAGMKIPMNFGPAYTTAFEKVYVDLVEEYDLISIPFLLDGVALNPDLNISDGIHPNERGHEVITKTVYPVLKELIASLSH